MTSFPTNNLNKYLSAREHKWSMLVFCAYFMALLSSQSLMELFSAILTLTALTLTIRHFKNEWSWPRLGIQWLWLIWAPIIAIGLYMNPVREDRLKIFFEFRWILDLYIFIIFFSLFNQDQRVRKIFVVTLTLASAIALLFYFLGYDPIYQSWSDRDINLSGLWRAGGLFNSAMPLAHSYGPLVLVFVGFLMQNWDLRKRLSPWLFAAIILTMSVVILTFTRGVWIGVVAGLISMGFILHRKLGIVILSSMTIVGFVAFLSSDKIHTRVMDTVNMTNQGDHERITLWKTNWEIFKDHPIFGAGYSQNRSLLRTYYDSMGVPAGYFEGHAHNQYIHFLSGTGVLGLICYLIFIGYMLIKSYQAYRYAYSRETKGTALGCIGAQICFHVGSLTEANFSIGKNRLMIIFIMSWVLSIYLQQSKQISHSQKTNS